MKRPEVRLTIEQLTKTYGLTGTTVKVKLKAGNSDAYPWQGLEVPVKIIGEYPYFLLGLVLPHRAPNGWGESTPYRITLHKHDIYSGEMIINGGAIR